MKQLLRYEQSQIKTDYSMPGLLRMNLNENLVLPSAVLRKAMRECERSIDPRFYPSELDSGEMKALRHLLASYCGSKEWMVQLGCGSDQLIDLLCRMTLEGRSGTLVTVKPTFSMYELRARSIGARVREVELHYDAQGTTPFILKTDEIVRACNSPGVRLLVLASPNNPTSIQYDFAQVKEILESTPPGVFVVIDEAYVEYARYSVARLLGEYPSLIILRTFSKAFGLASLRIGYLLSANPKFIQLFENRFQYPFPITTVSARLAFSLLKKKAVILRYAEETKNLRRDLISELEGIRNDRFQVIPRSDCNFVLLESKKSREIARALLARHRIAVKYLPGMIRERSFIRMTVGTGRMNSKLLAALKETVRDQ